ncbi:MAG: hypothetical protein U0350_30075 [Caldilineaceae bacterium]
MYTYDYAFSFSPAMPVVAVEMTNIEGKRAPLELTAMLDSGSGGTMVPLAQLRTIKAHRAGQVIMRSITGERSIVDIYEVALRIGPHFFPYVRVAADKHKTGKKAFLFMCQSQCRHLHATQRH